MAVFFIGMIFAVGADAQAEAEHQASLNTPEKQREEGDRLIERALHCPDIQIASYLRDLAQAHYTKADRMEAKAQAGGRKR